jgi:hypothetical protein
MQVNPLVILQLMDLVPAVATSIDSVAKLFDATAEELDLLREQATRRLKDSHDELQDTD